MATTIRYNNINIFSGLAPTPLFSRSVEMIQVGERWGQKHNITLRGMLTGRCRGYTGVVADANTLVSRWGRSYQTLEIYDGVSLVTGYSGIQVEQIRFPNSVFGGPTPFEISLSSYPSEYFTGEYKVLNPVDSFDFSEGQDGLISFTHTVSAVGIPTASGASNALDNASGWVAARTGWSSQIMPVFVTGTGFVPCLQGVAESIDRLNGRYEVRETYTADKYSMLGGILRYSTELNSGIDGGLNTVSVRGSLKACKNATLSGMRARYSGFNAFDEANNVLYMAAGRYDLNQFPVSKSVVENQQALSISFDYNFSDDLKPRTTFEYEVSFDYDFDADVVTSTIAGAVTSKDVAEYRWTLVTGLANSLNLRAILEPHHNAYVAESVPHLSAYPLNPVPIVKARTENQFESRIELRETYSNAVVPPPNLDAFSYSMDFAPALHQYSANPIFRGTGEYYIFDLGFARRASWTIRADGRGSSGISSDSVVSNLLTQAAVLRGQYFTGTNMVLDAQSVSVGNANFSGNASITAQFSCDQPEF